MFDLLWSLVDRLLLLLLLLLLLPAGVVGGGEVLGQVRGEVRGGGGEGACTTRRAVGRSVSYQCWNVRGILGKFVHFSSFAQRLRNGGNREPMEFGCVLVVVLAKKKTDKC